MKDEVRQSILPAFSNDENQREEVETFGQKKTEENDVIAKYEQAYEAQLKEALDTIVGVVM